MRNYQLIQGFVFETLLTVVALGCGSSASDGGAGTGGGSAAAGRDSSTGGSAATIGGGFSAAGSNGSGATTTPNLGGASTGGAATTLGGNAAAGGEAGSRAGGVSTGGNSTATLAGGTAQTGGLTAASGGNGSLSGGTPVLVTGIRGDSCQLLGSRICDGSDPKLTLLCNTDNVWVADDACGATEACDARSGDTQGTCQPLDDLCAAGVAGQRFCIGNAEWTCEETSTKAIKVRDCAVDGVCYAGTCITAHECSALGHAISCTSDCAGASPGSCGPSYYSSTLVNFETNSVHTLYVAHLSYAGGATTAEIGELYGVSMDCSEHPTRREYHFSVPTGPSSRGDYYYRIVVPDAWKIAKDASGCSLNSLASCFESLYGGPAPMVIYSDDVNSPDFNLFIEFTRFDERRPCP